MSLMGVWMWPESVRAHGAERAAALCAGMGVSDIYFLTKGLTGVVSYKSGIAPCDQGPDLLRGLLDAAHRRGIRVHAWFTSASDESYKALHPESGRCHLTRGRDQGIISLAHEGYMAYQQQVIGELCRRYDIDGLHLDYIRYNHLMYGWDENDLARYKNAGADTEHVIGLIRRTFLNGDKNEPQCVFDALRQGDRSVRAVADVRRADVLRFARRMIDAARAEKNDLILSAALMPEGAYEDTAFADLHYGQSYEDAAVLYDHVLPMAYSKAYEKDSAWVRQVALGTLKKGCRAVIGLHAFDGGTLRSLAEDIAALDGLAVDGCCLFRAGAFVPIFRDGAVCTLYNALSVPVTALRADAGGDILGGPVMPGEEKCFALPCPLETLHAYSGGTEVCGFITNA